MMSFHALSDFLHTWLNRRAQTSQLPGFAVALAFEGEIFFSNAYGLAHPTTGEVLTLQHTFPIGSQSKMITATAIMLLVERGLLGVDTPIVSILPWLKRHADPAFQHITVGKLLWHGAGMVRDGANADYWQLARPFPDQTELQNLVLNSRLTAAANKKMKYSNIGYALLGQVIETVTNQNYESFCRQTILLPLKLSVSMHSHHTARGHTRLLGNERLIVPTQIATHALSPAIGWHATGEDMNRFMSAHFINDTLGLSSHTKRLMRQGVRGHWVPPDYRGTSYGLGLQTYIFDGEPVFGHCGTFVGHRSGSFFFRDSRITLAIMANAKDAPILRMARGIGDVCRQFLHSPSSTPWSHKKFNVLLESANCAVQIVTVGRRIVTIFPDDWQPFLGAEELRQHNGTTLVVERASDLAAEGEFVHFEFGQSGVKSVNYTGVSMLPEINYKAWLDNNFKKWE